MDTSKHIFEETCEFPDPDALDEYYRLVGLDKQKQRLLKEAMIMIDSESINVWASSHHGKDLTILENLKNRPPLFLFCGDVGTGKTALAKSFGAEVSKSLNMSLRLFPLGLQSRGSGSVGEMTQLLSSAFAEVLSEAKSAKGTKKGVILLIDEADAVVQSRELSQMHHEDRAGVNAVLRGIDDLAGRRLPIIVLMCTNRLDAIDPAVRRRCAAVFEFERPGPDQRKFLLEKYVGELGLTPEQLEQLVSQTGGTPGYTFSDFTQRLFPAVILNAFPDAPITFQLIVNTIKETEATPPFNSSSTKEMSNRVV